ncbi:MAG: hypothetical protein Q7U57_13440 [Methylovulum sp.]|nr:hypothetical protein [Methylovulum sp.]
MPVVEVVPVLTTVPVPVPSAMTDEMVSASPDPLVTFSAPASCSVCPVMVSVPTASASKVTPAATT